MTSLPDTDAQSVRPAAQPSTTRKENAMPLIDHASASPVEMLPGVVRRTMTDGEKMMLCEIEMKSGAVVPMHTHPHEQTGYLASGSITMQIGDESRELSAGDCWMIPGGVPHEATALDDSRFVDVFSPPREEYRVSSGQ
jgi:quercetin dioxygenase-like cupin family protein